MFIFPFQVVFGAPAAPGAALQDFQLSAELAEKIKVNLECVRGVVSEVIKDNEVDVWWSETKTQVTNLYEDDWKKCLETESVEDQQK